MTGFSSNVDFFPHLLHLHTRRNVTLLPVESNRTMGPLAGDSLLEALVVSVVELNDVWSSSAIDSA